MSHAPRSRRLAFTDIADIAAATRERGGRFSTPRRLVLEALFAADGPVSAEYIAQDLHGPGRALDHSSIYRALEHLEQLGVVRHVHLGHGPGLYALTHDSEREYLACERCSRVTTVPAARLDAVRSQIREAFGYEARFSHFPIVGLCARCAASEDATPASARPTDNSRRGGDVTHDEHPHEDVHTHEHSHGQDAHTHPHTEHDHDHVEHEHEHSHGDHVHAHPHVHQEGLEDEHGHGH